MKECASSAGETCAAFTENKPVNIAINDGKAIYLLNAD
jgi:hypothetical protein